jgi:hypothetical protein
LDTGLKFSNNGSILISFFKIGFSRAIFQWSGTRPSCKEKFTILVIEGTSPNEQRLTSHGGIGSNLQLALDNCIITSWISWKESLKRFQLDFGIPVFYQRGLNNDTIHIF